MDDCQKNDGKMLKVEMWLSHLDLISLRHGIMKILLIVSISDIKEFTTEVLQILIDLIAHICENENELRLMDGDIM